MTQRPGITKPPLGLAPALILKRCHRLVALRLSRLSALESPPGITPRQRCLDLVHRLVRVDRLIEERFGCAPGPPRCPRHPSCIPPAPLGLGHLGIGLARRLALTLGSLLYPPQGPLQLPLGVKDVEAHRDRHWRDALGLLSQGRAGFIGQLPPPLTPRAPIGTDV